MAIAGIKRLLSVQAGYQVILMVALVLIVLMITRSLHTVQQREAEKVAMVEMALMITLMLRQIR